MRDIDNAPTLPPPDGAELPAHTYMQLTAGAALALALFGDDPNWVPAEERVPEAERDLSWLEDAKPEAEKKDEDK